MTDFRTRFVLSLSLLTAAAAIAQDHRVRSAAGTTDGGLPYVDIVVDNVTSPYDPQRDIEEFIWSFRFVDQTTAVVGTPEIDDFVLTLTDWPAGEPAPAVMSGPLVFQVRPLAPFASAVTSLSFRMTYDPQPQQVGDEDPAPELVHWRDYGYQNGSWRIYYAGGLDQNYMWQEACLTTKSMGEYATSIAGGVNVAGIAADGGRVAATYVQGTTLWCALSDDEGRTWITNPVTTQPGLSSGNFFSKHVGVGGGRIHVAWTDLRTGAVRTYYAWSDDAIVWHERVLPAPFGQHGTAADFELVQDPAGDPTQAHVHLAVRRFSDAQVNDSEILVSTSLDGGVTFHDAVPYQPTNGTGFLSGLDASRGAVHLHYRNTSNIPSLSSSLDGGQTWATRTFTAPFHPLLVACADAVVVAARSNGNNQWEAQVSTDHGDSWSPTRIVGTHDPMTQTVSKLNVHVGRDRTSGALVPVLTWNGYANGSLMHVASRSIDAGLTWSDEKPVRPAVGQVPLTIGDDGDVLMLFAGGQLDYSTDGGESFVAVDYTRALWSTAVNTGQHGTALDYDAVTERCHVGLRPPAFLNFTPFVASNRVVTASESVRTAGSNPDVLRTSRFVPGDDALLTCELAATGHAFCVFYVGTGQVAVPLFGADHVLLGVPFTSVFVAPTPGEPARLWLQAPFGYYDDLTVQALLADFSLPLRLSNAIDIVPGGI